MRISDWSSDVCSSDLEIVEHGFQQASIACQTGLVDLHPAVWRSLGKKIGRGKRRVAEEILLAGIAALRACGGRLGRLNIDGRALGRGDGGTGRCLHGGGAKFRSIVAKPASGRSEEHTSELQSLMRISYAVFCLKKKKKHTP